MFIMNIDHAPQASSRLNLLSLPCGLRPARTCPLITLIHRSAENWNSRNSVFRILHITSSQGHKARSSAHPRLVWDFYNLWRCIDIRARECSTAAVDLDRTTHVSCVVLHSPVSGVANPGPCLYPRRRAFPYWVSSASSDRESSLCWRVQADAGPVWMYAAPQKQSGARVPEIVPANRGEPASEAVRAIS
jgi:hypothetical protein